MAKKYLLNTYSIEIKYYQPFSYQISISNLRTKNVQTFPPKGNTWLVSDEWPTARREKKGVNLAALTTELSADEGEEERERREKTLAREEEVDAERESKNQKGEKSGTFATLQNPKSNNKGEEETRTRTGVYIRQPVKRSCDPCDVKWLRLIGQWIVRVDRLCSQIGFLIREKVMLIG